MEGEIWRLFYFKDLNRGLAGVSFWTSLSKFRVKGLRASILIHVSGLISHLMQVHVNFLIIRWQSEREKIKENMFLIG